MIYPDEDMRRWESCDSVVLADADNYYTKGQVDEKIDEIIISGGGITEGEVQDMIDASISGKAETSAITAIDEAYKAADASISGAVDNLSSSLQTEAERAVSSEQGLSNNISALSGEVSTISGSLETQIQTIENELDNDYATEEWVNSQGFLTQHQSLDNYYTKSEVDTKDANIEARIPSLSGYATEAFVSGYTYDKTTIDEKVAQGGTFDPSQYYNKTATDALLNEKLDVTAYTPTDLSNYYQKSETSGSSQISTALNGKVDNSTFNTYTASTDSSLSGKASQSDLSTLSGTVTAHTANTDVHVTAQDKSNWDSKSDFSGSYNDLTDKPTIPTVPTSNTAFTNDAHYATTSDVQTATNDMATKTWVGQQGFLTQHQDLSDYALKSEIPDVSGKQDASGMTAYTTTATTDALNTVVTAHTANTDIHVTTAQTAAWDGKSNFSGSYNDLTNKPTIPVVWQGTKAQYNAIASKDPNTIYLIYEE